jgi:hypothetical protein
MLSTTPSYAWFIWGRKGEAARVSEKAISWPAGLTEGDTQTTKNWGTIVMSKTGDKPEGASVNFSASTIPCVPEGLITEEEWDFSQADIVETMAGPMMVTGHVCGESLTVAIVMPAVVTISERTEVMLMLAPMKSPAGGLAPEARAFLLGYDARRQSTTVRTAQGVGGAWKWGFDEIGPARAGLTMRGDDSARFLVAEYSIPFSAIGAKVDETKSMAMGIIVRGLPKHQKTEEMLYWPAGHAPATPIDETLVCAHPDGWSTFRLGNKKLHREEIALPTIDKAPILDGKVDPDEWKGSASFGYDWLGIGHVKMNAVISAGKLWLAAVCDPPRMGIGSPRLEVLLDPEGDGGLLPRSDDVLVLPGDGKGQGKIMYWKLPAAAARTGTVNFVGKWTLRQPSPGSRVVFVINQDRINMEAMVDLADAGVDPAKLPVKMGMMTRIGYKAEYTIEHGK